MTDSGAGIPPEHLPHIFDRFYKADPSRASSRGSGLGLAIARENARLLGGDVTAANVPDGGARFVLTLPAASTDPADRARRPIDRIAAGPCHSVTRSLPDRGRPVKSAVKHGHMTGPARRREATMRHLARTICPRRVLRCSACWSCSLVLPLPLVAAGCGVGDERRRRRHGQHHRRHRGDHRRPCRPKSTTTTVDAVDDHHHHARPSDTMTVRVYFSRDEKICAATRVIPKTQEVGAAAMKALLEGPTAEEKEAGMVSNIPEGTTFLGPRHRERRRHGGPLQGVRVGRRQPLDVHAAGRGGLHPHPVPHGGGRQLQARRRADRRPRRRGHHHRPSHEPRRLRGPVPGHPGRVAHPGRDGDAAPCA